MFIRSVLTFFVFFSISQVSAYQRNYITKKVKDTKPQPAPVEFGFSFSSSYNAQIERQKDGSRAEYLQHEIAPSLKLGEYSILGFFYYYDDLKTPSANEWQDSFLALTKNAWDLGDYFKLTPSASITLPLSKQSREVVGAKYSIGASLSLGVNPKQLPSESLSLAYSLGFSKMYTEYETSTKGEPVTAYRIRQRITAGYQITDAFSFKTRFQFDSSYSYADVVRNQFLHFQSFEYQFTPNISGNVTHSNGNNAFLIKESEQDFYLQNNIKFYDPKVSEISIGLGISF